MNTRLRPSLALVVAVALLVAGRVAPFAATSLAEEARSLASGRPTLDDNPFAAHNAYPWRLYGNSRFRRALASGLKHLEIDVTYDPQRRAVVATHDSKPRGGEPELGQLLEPLWQQWGSSDQDGYTLIIDFKTVSPALAAGVHKILVPHAALLSSMRKGDASSFEQRKITVCLTGADACQVLYAATVPKQQPLLAFGDYGHSDWRADAASYVPDEPPGFDRFLTFNISCFRRSADARGIDAISDERLRTVVRLANQRGYRMRVYTINPPKRKDGTRDDRIWRQCVEAGTHMISTDLYEEAAEWWRRYVQQHASAAQ